jgi:DNA-binding transcriptional ArsR family regulator
MSTSEQLGFRALADPTRRDILHMLATREMTIAQVSENFQMTRAAVKKHLTILNDGGLIHVRIDGRTKVNSLNTDGMKQVLGWFDYFNTFWDDNLAALKADIEKDRV